MSGGPPADAFRERVATALAAPEGGTLGALMRAPTVTAIVADPRDDAWLGAGLATLLAVLDRSGVPRGRALVLLAATVPPGVARAVAQALRASLGVPAIAHDPDRSACFGAGRTPAGALVELNDELREAEAVVLFAAARPATALAPGAAGLVFPGLASRVSARAVAREADAHAPDARDAAVRVARACAPLDLAVHWRADAGTHAWAGAGERSDDAIERIARVS